MTNLLFGALASTAIYKFLFEFMLALIDARAAKQRRCEWELARVKELRRRLGLASDDGTRELFARRYCISNCN